jgi:DNA repair protein RadC
MLTANTIERVALQTVALELLPSLPAPAPAPFFSDLSAPAHIARLGQHLLSQDPEILQYVFLLDTEQKLFAFMEVPGAIFPLIVRDVFRFALLDNAASFAFCALRSGSVVPRAGDYALLQQLSEAAGVLGLQLYDHLLVSNDEYYSFRELGLL